MHKMFWSVYEPANQTRVCTREMIPMDGLEYTKDQEKEALGNSNIERVQIQEMVFLG